MQELINNIVRLFIENPVAQSVGFLAFFFQVLAFSNKDDQKRLMLQFTGFITWTVHYFLMGLMTPAIIYLVYGARNYVSVNYKPNYKISIIFIIFFLIDGVLTYKNIYSILPIIGAIISVISVMHFRGLTMRTLSMIGALLWLTYNFIEGSIGGVVSIIILTSINLITMFRILLDRRRVRLEEVKTI